MYIICVVKNSSMWVCRCRAILLQCLICSWLVIGCCWVSASLLFRKLPSQHSITLLTAAIIKAAMFNRKARAGYSREFPASWEMDGKFVDLGNSPVLGIS